MKVVSIKKLRKTIKIRTEKTIKTTRTLRYCIKLRDKINNK